MVKVALIVPTFPKLSETFIVNKFLGLLGRGYDAHVVCAAGNSAAWSKFERLRERPELRARVHVSWPTRPLLLIAPRMLAALLRLTVQKPVATWLYLCRGWRRYGVGVLQRLYLDAELVRLRPDVIHFEFGALAVGRTYLKELLGCKLVVSFRGYDLNYVGLEEADFYREVWDEADGLHFLGQDLRARALRRGCPPRKLHAVIPPAIDSTFFAPAPPAERGEDDAASEPTLRVLSVGRLEWKKGYEYALQAVRLLIDQGVGCEYRIVGDGEYLEAIAFARHQLGLDDRVQLLGALSGPEVRAQMRWADIMLHSAVSEGFCNAVLEAQAMTLPVVCTDADGLAENVADGETGFVVPRRNPAQLSRRMLQLAKDPELRRRMGGAGRNRVQAHFNLTQQTEGFSELYQQVLGTLGQPREDGSREFCDERAR